MWLRGIAMRESVYNSTCRQVTARKCRCLFCTKGKVCDEITDTSWTSHHVLIPSLTTMPAADYSVTCHSKEEELDYKYKGEKLKYEEGTSSVPWNKKRKRTTRGEYILKLFGGRSRPGKLSTVPRREKGRGIGHKCENAPMPDTPQANTKNALMPTLPDRMTYHCP
ncbi:hypothetical protein SARC_05565 [Sphaeroforma arctica JP610]|uniref:Uncharacterized protein n=1 Tax=Sphaeroforma arctica JP610 TaxID=667725 RepID=A0A0L0FZ97_9EUKA|nr:hypothetical protein SARC_05565 [Sphaeroforma arctica JP610]KNC82145.1 hypothetical protein SARC_05565 [Sphaeroforma arctica JP610]|eukprot:XP_014156047.1 hypothetical protein SARC_05565 [Sphaeroforma arctica JP610]